jgi:branched-chain amino acid transport system ATP-binding protein
VLDNLMVGARDCAADSPIRLMLNPGAAKASEAQACQRAMKILADIGLDGVASQPAADLTYGQQKLVGVGRALMNEPRCLLLDEPMAGVEGQAYGTMQKVIRDLAAAGVAICVVEHNVAFIRDLCDEGVFMFAGKVLARGAVETLIADQQLTELYFGT